MRKIRRIINMILAIIMANIPSFFPNKDLILFIYIVGLLTICIIIYKILEEFNK